MKAINFYLLLLLATISCSDPVNMDREKILISKYIEENDFEKAESIAYYLLNSTDTTIQNTADSLLFVIAEAHRKTDSVGVVDETEAQKELLSRFQGETKNLKVELDSGLVLTFGGFSITNKWIVDRYDDTYHYREAERDMVYITSDLTIKSKSKNPQLPRILLLSEELGVINRIGVFDYEFYRWTSHGTYIGLYHDSKNDFAFSEKVKFTVGIQIDKSLLSKNLAIAVTPETHFRRVNKLSGNPEIGYEDDQPMKLYQTMDYANMHWIQSKI